MAVLTYTGARCSSCWGRPSKTLRGGIDVRDLLEQMASLGVNSVAIALLTASTSGGCAGALLRAVPEAVRGRGFHGRGRRPRYRADAGAGPDRSGRGGAGRGWPSRRNLAP